MSSNAKADEKKSDKAEDVKKTDTKEIENLLEEDDEFEEFPQESTLKLTLSHVGG